LTVDRLLGGAELRLVELDQRTIVALARHYHGMQGYGVAVVVATTIELRQPLLNAIGRVVDSVNRRERAVVEDVVDKLLVDAPTPASLNRARHEAQIRLRILHDYDTYTGPELAELDRSTAQNRSQTAHRWRQQRRIFAVRHQGTLLYLAFQFDQHGHPAPVIEQVIKEVGDAPNWDLAYWFVRSNWLLEGRRPVDLLTEDPDAVIRAASHDAALLHDWLPRGDHTKDPERRHRPRPLRHPTQRV
jgi:hypothetical protein